MLRQVDGSSFEVIIVSKLYRIPLLDNDSISFHQASVIDGDVARDHLKVAGDHIRPGLGGFTYLPYIDSDRLGEGRCIPIRE